MLQCTVFSNIQSFEIIKNSNIVWNYKKLIWRFCGRLSLVWLTVKMCYFYGFICIKLYKIVLTCGLAVLTKAGVPTLWHFYTTFII